MSMTAPVLRPGPSSKGSATVFAVLTFEASGA
jgi:hypothetical protein